MKAKNPRAYDIGGFCVGAPVLRVEILEQTAFDRYKVKITSPTKGAYTKGEILEVAGYDLYDKVSFSAGPKCHFQGQEWKNNLPKKDFEKPLFRLTRN